MPINKISTKGRMQKLILINWLKYLLYSVMKWGYGFWLFTKWVFEEHVRSWHFNFVLDWIYLYIYIYIERERERERSMNINHHDHGCKKNLNLIKLIMTNRKLWIIYSVQKADKNSFKCNDKNIHLIFWMVPKMLPTLCLTYLSNIIFKHSCRLTLLLLLLLLFVLRTTVYPHIRASKIWTQWKWPTGFQIELMTPEKSHFNDFTDGGKG